MTRTLQLAGLIAILGLLFAVSTGCKKSNPSAGMPPTYPQGGDPNAVADTGPHAAGKKVFAANCARCHSVGPMGAGGPGPGGPGPGGPGGPGPGGPGPGGPGPGGPGPGGGLGMRGPNLAKTGQVAEHTVEWFMELIRDPKSKKENA